MTLAVRLLRTGATATPAPRARRADLLERSFEDLAADLGELETLAAGASDRVSRAGRVLLRHRRDLHGDSLDLIEDQLRRLIAAYDTIGREARSLRDDAGRGPRSRELLEGLTVERRGHADRLRTLQGIAAAAMVASEWQSPSFAHAGRPNAGASTGSVRAHVDDYRRDRHAEAAAFEADYLAAAADPAADLRLRALATISGMAAFTTILGYLQTQGKLDGPVVLGASVYHECRDLLRAWLPAASIVEVREHPTAALPTAIRRLRPAAVFLDSVGNAPGTPVPDLAAVVAALRASRRRAYLVLDNTALSATLRPFRLVEAGRPPRLIVFESLTKYAQFGMDRVTGGAIVAEGEDADELDRSREHLGTNIADAVVGAIPRPDRRALERRLARLERNAVVLAERINRAAGTQGGGCVVGADHPALPSHPCFVTARALPFRGGWLSIAFSPAHDRPEIHHRFVEIAIEEARRRHVALVAGASFGLDTTRVYPTAWTARSGRPFVRVSPGIEHAAAIEQVADVLAATVAALGRSA